LPSAGVFRGLLRPGAPSHDDFDGVRHCACRDVAVSADPHDRADRAGRVLPTRWRGCSARISRVLGQQNRSSNVVAARPGISHQRGAAGGARRPNTLGDALVTPGRSGDLSSFNDAQYKTAPKPDDFRHLRWSMTVPLSLGVAQRSWPARSVPELIAYISSNVPHPEHASRSARFCRATAIRPPSPRTVPFRSRPASRLGGAVQWRQHTGGGRSGAGQHPADVRHRRPTLPDSQGAAWGRGGRQLARRSDFCNTTADRS